MQVGEDQGKMDLISARVQMQGKEKELVFVWTVLLTGQSNFKSPKAKEKKQPGEWEKQ